MDISLAIFSKYFLPDVNLVQMHLNAEQAQLRTKKTKKTSEVLSQKSFFIMMRVTILKFLMTLSNFGVQSLLMAKMT